MILQNTNFTTAQRTYLMFDLARLNSSRVDESLGYILETLREDKKLQQVFEQEGVFGRGFEMDLDCLDDEQKHALLADSKRLIAEFCEKRSSARLRQRLSVSASLRKRDAEYLMDNRALNSVLVGLRPRIFLQNKRGPVDTKTAHGKYAIEILEGILKNDGFQFLDYPEPRIRRGGSSQESLAKPTAEFSYCREKEVESLSHRGTSLSSGSATTGKRTAKRFDFVLLHEHDPKVVIETNFYTTSGSKIGINEKEYLLLHQRMAQTERDLRFIWVTDGSYWLTTGGRESFFRLAPSFDEDLMNIGLFAEELQTIKQSMREDVGH